MRILVQRIATKFYIWAFKLRPRNKNNKKGETEQNGKTTFVG